MSAPANSSASSSGNSFGNDATTGEDSALLRKVIGTWSGERVSVVLNLVAALPESEAMRCFVPLYAIRLRGGSLVLTEVAFCFQCHNAMSVPIADNTQPPTWFTFDPDSKPAEDLLYLPRSCAG
ncbi:hypothetical protein [Micromonospora sp. CPCC 206061]|uniref:hypothetical protein n=1 Tax=Micromonospora sp. CPCC 206061 TaxID=3122410 RepID=UPI002FF03838